MPKDGSYCYHADRDAWFYCDNNYGIHTEYDSLDCYKMGESECYTADMGWFDCYEYGCYSMGDQWSCERLEDRDRDRRRDGVKDAIEDVADDVADTLEDWAESQRDRNSDLVDSIAESTSELIGNVGRNVTESLSNAVNQRFDRIMNETAQALNQTRREILEGIQDAQEDIMRELDGEDSGEEWEEDWNLNLLSDAPNQQSTAATIAIGFTAGAATTFGLLMARKKLLKNDEDFQRA